MGTEEGSRLGDFEPGAEATELTEMDGFDEEGRRAAEDTGTELPGLDNGDDGIEDRGTIGVDEPALDDAGFDFGDDEATGLEESTDRTDEATGAEIFEEGADEAAGIDETLDETTGVTDDAGELERIGFPTDDGVEGVDDGAIGTLGVEETGTADLIGVDDTTIN